MTRLMSLMILVTVLFAVNAHAVVQSSANFTMNSNVLDSGGGSASSASRAKLMALASDFPTQIGSISECCSSRRMTM